jgi:hypothetical protein
MTYITPVASICRAVATYPLTSLLMAAVVGYGRGYLFSHRS